MPKMVPELSAMAVRRLKHPGNGRNVMFAVGGVSGLHLQITQSGARSWILRATVGSKRRDIGLGGFPDVSLAQARERAREMKDKIWQGIDPVAERKAAQAELIAEQRRSLTFAAAFKAYDDAKLSELGSDKDRIRWRSSIERYALPHVGDMLVADLTAEDMLRIIQPIWVDKNETARRVRGRVEVILAWATVAGHRSGDNPARWRGNLDILLPGNAGEKKHWPAVALADATAWFAELSTRKGVSARALEFLTLTASRSGMVRSLEWHDINFAEMMWVCPAHKMKRKVEHPVPLPASAAAIVQAMPRRDDSTYVFAAPRGGKLSDMSIGKVMRDMQARAVAAAERAGADASTAGWRDRQSGEPAVPHGLRSTFRDWAAELTDHPHEMAEIALAHEVGSEVERAYRRSDMLEKRRVMMTDWTKFIHGDTDGF